MMMLLLCQRWLRETNSLVSDRKTTGRQVDLLCGDLRCRGLGKGMHPLQHGKQTRDDTVGRGSRSRGSSAAYVTRLPAPSGGVLS
jgi:hypothetical protein